MRVKTCCIGSVSEARLAIRSGASALGLVSEMPSGPGVIPEALIGEIAAAVPPPIATFLLTERTDPDKIAAQQRRCRVNTLQLCDRVAPHTYSMLRVMLPGVSLVQVVHVRGEESVEEARRDAQRVDALLLDSGDPTLPVKELGGTGRTHDWSLSARIAAEVDEECIRPHRCRRPYDFLPKFDSRHEKPCQTEHWAPNSRIPASEGRFSDLVFRQNRPDIYCLSPPKRLRLS